MEQNIDTILQRLQKTLLCCSTVYTPDYLNEVFHTADFLIDVSEQLSQIAFERIEEIFSSSFANINNIANIINNLDVEYTGYNFNKFYKDALFKSLENNTKLQPIEKLDNESVSYPIYFQYSYQPTNTIKAQCPLRDMSDENLKESIYIVINVAQFTEILKSDELKDKAYCNLETTMRHELQHIFDMYILSDKNSLSKKINCITIDFKENNQLLTNEVSYFINMLLTMISPEEINARLAELEQMIVIFKNNKELRDKLFYDNYYEFNNKLVKLLHKTMLDDTTYVNTKGKIYHMLAVNPLINSITRVNVFHKYGISKLTTYKQTDIQKWRAYMLYIGIFMFRHNLIYVPEGLDKRVKEVLTNVSLINSIIDFKSMSLTIDSEHYDSVCNAVYDSLLYRFQRYSEMCDAKIKKSIDAFFDFKDINYLFGESYTPSLFNDSDEIILFRNDCK